MYNCTLYFVIIKAEHSKPLLQHINNQDPHIQFTVEEPSQQGTLPFLDTLVTTELNNTFTTSVYRKPIHTDQYLHWDSNHFITAKQSIYKTLAHRVKIVSSNQKALNQELLHISRALQACQYPNWVLNQLQHKFQRNNQPSQENNHNSNSTNNNTNSNNRNITIVVPYIQGTGEKIKKVCKSKGIPVHFMGTNTLRTLLVTPKDKDPVKEENAMLFVCGFYVPYLLTTQILPSIMEQSQQGCGL